MKKRILSGIQPTNKMHIGNYFGAVKNWVSLQDHYDCYYCVVDLHAMTMPFDSKEVNNNTFDMFVALLACGLDPSQTTIFVQSMVPEHTELCWHLNSVTSYGELSRMTQFKDKVQLIQQTTKENFVSAGLFNYPILQAADILIYKADLVPVGKDQEQHLELSRNIAVRFNALYGECFPLPEPLFTDVPKLMSLADPEKKMSKSLGEKHYIGIFDEEDEIVKKVKSAVTDAGGAPLETMSQGVHNLFEIIRACGALDIYDNLKKEYTEGKLHYKNLKEAVIEVLVDLTKGFRIKRDEVMADPDYVRSQIRDGGEKARWTAGTTIQEVRQRLGIDFYYPNI